MVKEYEYKNITVPKNPPELVEAKINELAEDGWELHSTETVKNGASLTYEKILLIFKRKV